MLPDAESVSAAVGRFVEEATQAGAAALATGAAAAGGGSEADVLDASLAALRTWRSRLNQVMEATREVVSGATTSVDTALPPPASAADKAKRPAPQRRDAQKGGNAAAVTGGGTGTDGAAPTEQLALTQTAPAADGNPVAGVLSWMGSGLRKVPGAVASGAVVAGGAVASSLSAIKIPGLRRASDPVPTTADEDEARAERAKAVALALALAEEAAEEARAATGALGRLFNQTAAVITSRGASAPSTGTLPGEGDANAVATGAVSQDGAEEAAAAVAAAKAAEAAMQEANRASTALLGALTESRAAGDVIEPAVLAALEELPAIVFDEDSYSFQDLYAGPGRIDDSDS
jgi:hypothetical protein